MKLLITGCTGFIGHHLAKALMRDGHAVHAIVRDASRLRLSELSGVHIYKGQQAELNSIIQQVKPDAVLHLASLFIAEHKPEQIASLIESNIHFGTQLLEAMAQNQVRHFINTGTAWQHFQNEDYNPVCLYAATKEAFEKILQFYIQARDFKAVSLELYDTYGPDDPRPKLLNLLMQTGRAKKSLAMSAGQQEINILHVSDVVRAFQCALKILMQMEASTQRTYVVGAEQVFKLQEIVQIFEKATDCKLDIAWGERPYRSREVMQVWNRGVRMPGWKQETTLTEGIKEMWDNDRSS